MYEEVMWHVSSILGRLSKERIHVPLPLSYSINLDDFDHRTIVNLFYDFNEEFHFKVNYVYDSERLFVADLNNVITQAYVDYNQRSDGRILSEIIIKILYENNIGSAIAIYERRQHLLNLIEEFYSAGRHGHRSDRFFTLRDLEAERNHYFPESSRSYWGDSISIEDAAYMRHPSTPYTQPRGRDLVERRLNNVKENISGFLLGELPESLFIRQVELLDSINEEYDRSCNFYGTYSSQREVSQYYQQVLQFSQRHNEQFRRLMYEGHFPLQNIEERGEKLLLENLTEKQKKCYKKHGYFIVKGGATNKSYKIKKGSQMNVYELDDKGNELVGWCFIPAGCLCKGDVMLSQKIGLELHEKESIKVANPFADNRDYQVRGPISYNQNPFRRMVWPLWGNTNS